jgi:quinol monooxygenase YgiN
MSTPILITGTIDFDPALHDDAVAAAKVVMAITAQEAGCELYVMATDLSDPGRFHLSERWTDADSLAAHSKGAHLKDFGRALRAAGAKGNSITRWDGATGQKLA